MSLANTLVLAFSQSQLAAPVRDRINAVESALLYLNREGVHASASLTPFLSPAFYLVADTKRALLGEGETQISLCRKGLLEFGYITSGEIATVPLTQDQKAFVQDLGFQIRGEAAADSPVKPIQLRRRPQRGLHYAVNEGYVSGCQLG